MTTVPPIDALRLTLAVVQPSPFCNIACRYCYLPETGSTRRMSSEVLEQTLRFLMRGKPGLLDRGSQMLFHCGEPLAVPVAFYREAFEMLARLEPPETPVRVGFSTNATLVSQEWCDLIAARGNVRVRVSMDGPAWLHDGQRVDRAGKGTFTRVMKGLERLRANHIPFDILCVVTQRTLGAAEELWHFFQSIGARSVGFCIEEVLGKNQVSSLQHAKAADQLREFFDVWLKLREREAPRFYVRELDEIIDLVSRPRRTPLIRTDNLPLSLITVRWDGAITLFSPELQDVHDPHYGDFIFGNVATDSMESLLASEKFRRVYDDIDSGVNQCRRECKYYRACGGGYPVSKLIENGRFDSTETLSCRLKVKAIADVVLEHLAEKRARAIARAAEAAVESWRPGVAAGTEIRDERRRVVVGNHPA